MRLQQALEVGSFAITAEVMPPRGGDASRTLTHARQLKGLVHAVNVTDGKNRVALLNWAMDHGKICRDGFNCCSLPQEEPQR